VACDLEVDVGRKVNCRRATAPEPFGEFSMSAYVVFTHIGTRDWIQFVDEVENVPVFLKRSNLTTMRPPPGE
jgi:hypothetical protein